MSRRLLGLVLATILATALQGVAAQGMPASPAPSRGGLIVYQAPSGGSSEDGIWLANVDGSNPRELAAGVEDMHLHPDWSPDGNRIVFEVQRGESGTLWTVNVDDSDAAHLFSCSAPCVRPESPAWSPDGNGIAFTSIEDTDGIEGPPDETAIQILDLTTMTVSEVVRTKFPTLMSVPRWSPDGAMLVVSVETVDEATGNDLGSVIAIIDSNGGDLQELTDPHLFGYYPDWNCAGDAIVFDSQALQWAQDPPVDPDTWNLYSIAPDGTGLEQITDAEPGSKVWQPSWTPDCERIVATMDDPNGRMAVFVDPESGAVSVINGRLATHVRVRPATN